MRSPCSLSQPPLTKRRGRGNISRRRGSRIPAVRQASRVRTEGQETRMAKALIIVESPAKTKTLKNFLGGDYRVEASMGHVRDLPEKQLGVDIENDFAPT